MKDHNGFWPDIQVPTHFLDSTMAGQGGKARQREKLTTGSDKQPTSMQLSAILTSKETLTMKILAKQTYHSFKRIQWQKLREGKPIPFLTR